MVAVFSTADRQINAFQVTIATSASISTLISSVAKRGGAKKNLDHRLLPYGTGLATCHVTGILRVVTKSILLNTACAQYEANGNACTLSA